MTNKEVIGSWDLESFIIEKPGGSRRNWGDDASGLLIYTEAGTMSVSINSKVKGSDLAAQFKSILFYSGTFDVKNDNTIVHNVTQASDPSRIGKEMVRKALLNGKKLTLIGEGEFGVAKVVWVRR